MKKRLVSLLFAVAICSTMIPATLAADQADQPDRPTLEEVMEFLRNQNGAYYDLDGRYGAQCPDFVAAYMNWLRDGNPYSGRYLVYNAYYFPTVAGWEPSIWEVIPNTPELVPQPGDIFVTKGGSSYGHVGVVISSTVSRATVIDQNSINSNFVTGHAAYLHDITWQGSYTPTYFIRYRNFAEPKAPEVPAAPSCDHAFLSRVEQAHPHRTYQICINCGYHQYTGGGSFSASCATCNPKTQWLNWSSWSTSVPAQAANREVEKREVVEGYNLVMYITQEANYPYTRNFRNYSVNGNYAAYGLRSSYGEFAYSRYATKSELDAAAVCSRGTYVYQDSTHVGGRYEGNGKAYYFSDGYYWYIESPVTRTEYRFRDQVTAA